MGITGWVQVTSSGAMTQNLGYVPNDIVLVELDLPTTATFGSEIEVTGKGSGGWKIKQGAGQQIHYGEKSTTSGTLGYLASKKEKDSVRMVCVVDDLEWNVLSTIGNLEIN